MLTRLIRTQLAIFGVLGGAALVFATLVYGDAPRSTGVTHMSVSVEFDDVSGLYPRALVTYRGVKVGQVESLDFRPDGVTVRVYLDKDADVPRDVEAQIKSTSAIGEQFIDLLPSSDEGPYLTAGDVIATDRTTGLQQITPVLESVNTLLESVPLTETEALLEQVDVALGGSTDDVAQIVDDTTLLVTEAQDRVLATTGLIRNLSPLFDTQLEIARSTQEAVGSLSGVTEQLRASNPDIEALLDNAPGALSSTRQLIEGVETTVPQALASGSTVAEVANVYEGFLRQSLIAYPALQARLQAALLPHANDGEVKLDLKTNVGNPPPCLQGYLPIDQRRDPADTSVAETPEGLYCQEPNPGPSGVRGARNTPCPNDPARRSPTPAGCGLVFDGVLPASASALPLPEGAQTPGMLDLLGGAPSVGGTRPWLTLLTGPLAP